MSVPAAFIGVVLIWATMPLAIKWSSEGANHKSQITINGARLDRFGVFYDIL